MNRYAQFETFPFPIRGINGGAQRYRQRQAGTVPQGKSERPCMSYQPPGGFCLLTCEWLTCRNGSKGKLPRLVRIAAFADQFRLHLSQVHRARGGVPQQFRGQELSRSEERRVGKEC